MFIRTIASSSNGNSTYIYNENTHIIVDCGIAAREILAKTSRTTFDAIFITHGHSDHIKSAGALGRKTKSTVYSLPSYLKLKASKFKNCTTTPIDVTQTYQIGSIEVKPFSTLHDSMHGSVGFTFKDVNSKFCFITDTGSISRLMKVTIADCNSYFMESDYDEALMEAYDKYDRMLKDRITSDVGHLSNQQAIEYIQTLDLAKVKVIILGHLSKNTNSPECLKELIAKTFPDYTQKFHIAPLAYDLEV
jgi:phosphoribosyl 1,2-cyclic phosphodiesterase